MSLRVVGRGLSAAKSRQAVLPDALDLTGGAFSEQQLISVVEAKAQINVWEGAIRSGKTFASIIAWLNHLRVMKNAEGEAFIFGRTRDSVARNIFGPIASAPLLRALAPPSSTHYTPGAPTARVLGQLVHVLGSNDRQAEEKIRGLTGKSAYADEITVLPRPMFQQATGRLSVDGARLFGTTNPDNPGHWLRTEYLDRPRTQGRWTPGEDDIETLDLATWHFVLDDNPHVSDKFKRDRKAEYTGLWYRRMILGEWVQAEGAIYEAWDPQVHVVDELPTISRVLGVGIDHGTVNPTHAVTLALTADGRLAVTREWRYDSRAAGKQLTNAEYAARLRVWLDSDPPHPKWIVVDPAAQGLKLDLQRAGLRGLQDADNAVVDGIREVASLLATRRLIVHRSCTGLISEIPGYCWDDKAAEKGEDRPVKVADHGLDATRYVIKTLHPVWRKAVPLTPWSPAT